MVRLRSGILDCPVPTIFNVSISSLVHIAAKYTARMAATFMNETVQSVRAVLKVCRLNLVTMPDETILCWKTTLEPLYQHVTVADYKAWKGERQQGMVKLATFVKERLQERYIDPVKALGSDEKNGFAIMALSCLLMETLESFYRGWPKSANSELAFCSFFDRQRRFNAFRGYAKGFYKNVRCGILHQGETTGGWSITRQRGKPLFDPKGPQLHATKFHNHLALCVDEYSNDLQNTPLHNALWVNFFKKMDATIRSTG